VWLESEQSISTSVDQVADRYAVPLKQVWSQRSTRSQQKRSHQTSRERSKDRAPDVEASVDAAGLDEPRMSAESRVGELELKLREEIAAREEAERLLRDAQKELQTKVRSTARQCELQARQIASQQAALREDGRMGLPSHAEPEDPAAALRSARDGQASAREMSRPEYATNKSGHVLAPTGVLTARPDACDGEPPEHVPSISQRFRAPGLLFIFLFLLVIAAIFGRLLWFS